MHLYQTRQFSAIFHFIITIKITIASQFCDDVANDHSDQSFVLGDTVCEQNNRLSTIVLAIIWVLLHAILWKFPNIITNRVRLTALHKRCHFPLP